MSVDELEGIVRDVAALGAGVSSDRSGSLYWPGGVEWLDSACIANGLRSDSGMDAGAIDVRFEIDSTNAHLMREATATTRQDKAGRRRVCLAEVQSAGRGRRGRTWVSPLGRGLCLSLAEPVPASCGAPGSSGAGLAGISLAIGVAVVEVLRGLGVGDAALKWPNDVQWRGAKLAGILVESTTLACARAQGEPQPQGGPTKLVVVGIGLNHSLGGELGLDQPWTDLHRACESLDVRTPGRNELAAAMLNHLGPALDTFWCGGFAAFKQRFERLHALAGQQVRVSGPPRPGAISTGTNSNRSGRVIGVDDDGALLLETVTGVERIVSGEVSVRRQRQPRAEILG